MRPSVVVLALLLVGSCVGGERATGPDVAELALTIQPALIPSAADGSALPIHRIGAVVARQPDGAVLRELRFDVSPTAASWTLELAIPVGRESTEVIIYLSLLNVTSDGTEAVQFSGRTAPLVVSSGMRLADVDADIVRGPLSNLSVTGITITSSPDTLYVGASSTLSATVTSAASTPVQVFWTSLDPPVVGLADSVATGLSAGTAEVVASAGAHADTVSVVVIVPAVDSVRVSPDSADVLVGQTRSYTAQLFDANGGTITGRPVTWTTGNASIATVSASGVVTGVTVGTTMVRATSEGVFDEAVVRVMVVAVDSVRVSPDSADVQVGQTRTYSAQLFDANGGTIPSRPITWTTGSASIATVDASGVVTGVAAGTTTVRATSEGVFDQAVVRVTAAPAPGGGNTWSAIRSGNWSDPAGWSLNRIPQAGDTVYLTANDDYTITLDVDATVARLVIGGTSDVISLNVGANDLTVAGDIVLGPLANLQVNTGTISAAVILNNGTVRVLGGSTIDADVENYDDWRISGLNASMSMTRVGGGYFYNEGALSIDTTAVLNMGPEGGLEFAGGSATFSDAGIVLIGPSGELVLDQDLAIDGPHIILVDSEIDQFSNSRLTVGPESLVQLTAPSFQSVIAPKLEVQGALFVSGPDILMEDSLIVANGGIVAVDGSAGPTNYRTLAVQNDGTILMSGTNPVSFGPGSNPQSLVNLTNGTVQIAFGGDRVINGQLLNQGQIRITGPTTLRRSLSPTGSNPVTANHVSSGIIELFVGGSLDIELGGASPTFTNSGSIVVAGSTTLSVENLASPAGQIINAVGGVLAGTGTVDVSVGVPEAVNNGVIAPGVSPGILTWMGSIPMGPTGGIEIELDGTTPGTGHDQINVSSSLVLNGNGVLDVTAGFVPAPGDRFAVLTFVGRQGTFGTVNLPSPSGIVLDTLWVDNTVDTLYIVASAAGPAAPVNRWTGGTGAWSVGTNWSQGTVPDAADSVVIDGTGFETITLDVNASVRNLMLGGSSGQQNLVAIAPRTLTIGGASVVNTNGRLNLPGATINGTGSLTTIGQTTFDGNTVNVPITNPGWLQIGGTTVLNGLLTTTSTSLIRVGGIGGTPNLTVASSFTNNGSIELTSVSAANTTLTVGGTLTNLGTLSSLTGAGGSRTLTAPLDNQGTLNVAEPLTIDAANAAHTNSGTISVTAGPLTVSQTASGSFTNQAGGSISLTGGAPFGVGSFFYGVSITGGTLDMSAGQGGGGFGVTSVTNATLVFTPAANSGAAWNFSNVTTGPISIGAGESFSMVGGSVSAQVTSSGSLWLSNATLNGDVILANSGWLMGRGTSAINGSVTTGATTQLTVRGDATWGPAVFTISNGFTNNGILELPTLGASSAQLAVTTGSLTNAPGATLISPNFGATTGTRTIAAPLDNQGTVTVDLPLTLSSTLDQRASLTVAANQAITVGGLMTLFPGSTTTANAGASVLTNGGCLNSGGVTNGWTCQ